jgi:hypothetical protein
MHRRHFLMSLAAVTAAATAGLPIAIPAQDPLEAMRALGRTYLKLHPEETPAALAWQVSLAEAGETGMRGHTARHARLDLEDGAVVTVDGWVLPRSLALTCSALALA